MLAMGADADVKILRHSYGRLDMLAEEIHVHGRLFLDGDEITHSDCCTEKSPIYTTGVLFNFSDCVGDQWNNTEAPFEVASAANTWVQKTDDYIDSEFSEKYLMGTSESDCLLNSYIAGESSTGATISDSFYVTSTYLSFWSVGFTSGTCDDRLGEVASSFVAVVCTCITFLLPKCLLLTMACRLCNQICDGYTYTCL